MTKDELKEIIQECIDEINEESVEESVDINSINEDSNIVLNEGFLEIIGAIIVLPYLFIIVISIIVSIYLGIEDKKKKEKIKDLIKKHPEIRKAIINFCDKTKESYKKVCNNDAKYLIDTKEDYLSADNFIFKNNDKTSKDTSGKLIVDLFTIDCKSILKDLYGTKDLIEYYEKIKYYGNEYPARLTPLIKKKLEVFNKAVSEYNETLKSISKSKKNIATMEIYYAAYNNEYYNGTDEAYSFYASADYDNEYIIVRLIIDFKDYEKIQIDDKYKAKFAEVLTDMKSKLKLQ